MRDPVDPLLPKSPAQKPVFEAYLVGDMEHDGHVHAFELEWSYLLGGWKWPDLIPTKRVYDDDGRSAIIKTKEGVFRRTGLLQQGRPVYRWEPVE